jgi:aspartyl-tRNA(Asn)/glutamyl-tRNA(Gln) amidotransferase subunit A
MARTVAEVATLFAVMAGHDPEDATSADVPVVPVLEGLEEGVAGLRLGVVTTGAEAGAAPAVAAAVDAALARLVDAGAETRSVEVPSLRHALAIHSVIANAEASTNLARFDGIRYGRRQARESFEDTVAASRGAGLGPEVKRRIMIGAFVLSARHRGELWGRAVRARRVLTRELCSAFDHVDALVGPAAPTTAFAIGAKLDDPMDMYRADAHTLPASLAGLPALCAPCGYDEAGLPVGLQITGPAMSEALLLRVGRAVEAARPEARPWPKVADSRVDGDIIDREEG